MKVQLDLYNVGEHNCQMLRSWASVGRLFDAAIRQLSDAYDELETEYTSDELNDMQNVIEDLTRMKQPLDQLHYQVRALLVDAGIKPLWDQNQK